jgi:formate dehydrogenase major subunit
MAETDKTIAKKGGMTRRDFLKVSAATAAAGGFASALDFSLVGPNPALAATVVNNYEITTTCPYCSVGCNVRVGKDATGSVAGNVVDIVGDPDCPLNRGALCSKGSSTIQLVNSNRRLGVSDSVVTASRTYGPMKRVGNADWSPITWDQATTEIATGMVAAREASGNWITGGKVTAQARGVAFLGCSHMTNEQNWIYRKMIANFGTNNTEHQARI